MLLAAGSAHAQLPEHDAIRQAPAPAWVIEQPLAEPEVTDGQEIRYLLTDTQIRLAADPLATGPLGKKKPQEIYRRYAYRIESRTALENWSSWQIAIEPSFEQVVLHHLRVRRDGVFEDRLGRSRASMLQREAELDRQIFDGRETLLLVIDDIRVGDVVDISYSTIGANPLFGDRFEFISSLGWSVPVARAHLRLSHPASRTIEVRPLAGAPAPTISREGDRVVKTWELEDLSPIEPESGTPSWIPVYPLIELGEYRDWSEVARWGVPIYRLRPAPGLDAVAATIAAEHARPRERLAAARRWVQDEIRYFAALLGPHSHAPHDPAEILVRRYGDCKDKTLLLIHLLEKLGLNAWPTLVHTQNGRGLPERLPSPAVFNHVIVTTEIDGDTIRIDPTLTLQGGRQHFHVPAYGFGLDLREDTRDLTPIESAPAARPSTEATYRYRLTDPAKGAATEIRTVYSNAEAERMRRTLASTPLDELQQNYLDFYADDTFELHATGPLEVTDDRAANTVEVVERYHVDSASDDGQIAFSALPLLLETDLPYPTDLETPRRTPWQLPYPLLRDETIVIEKPDANLYEAGEVVEDNDFFTFEVASRGHPSRLEVTYRLETKRAAVEPEDLPAYAEAVERLWAEVGFSVWADDAKIDGDPALRPAALRAFGVAAAALLVYVGLLALFLRRLLRQRALGGST